MERITGGGGGRCSFTQNNCSDIHSVLSVAISICSDIYIYILFEKRN